MIDFDMVKTGQRIKELRKEFGMSQKDLADKIGVAQNTVAQYENGTAKTSLDVIVKLAIALRITTDYLLGLEDESGLKK
ncbi:MAG: helix-turn-helix domain-containing protein [Clostridiales bacterium]|jgi:transcriptional regulator with XRE-family HTH domain|nr:helix-turn-helix domain-containing protein [Clostridiales bacterium]